jgi:hypothetical protein
MIAPALLCALAVTLSCSSTGPTVTVPPKGPEKIAFSEIGAHVLPDKRLVEFSGDILVSGIPEKAKKVQVWIPAPMGSTAQQVMEPIIESPASYRPIIRMDQNYNSPSIFVLADWPIQKEADLEGAMMPKEIRIRYTAQVERTRVNDAQKKPAEAMGEEALKKQFEADLRLPASLEADELSAALAAVPAPADNSVLARARAVYDHVLDAFEPDNATTAKPLKDALASKRGGALDYAAVTVALMRAAGIPARIESGFYLPENRTPDAVEATSHGAWVAFYVDGIGWTACDPYLADRASELKDYLFAGLDANRVQTGVGPEPGLLPPPAAGAPLVLADVIAEADGKLIAAKMTLTFRDVCPK